SFIKTLFWGEVTGYGYGSFFFCKDSNLPKIEHLCAMKDRAPKTSLSILMFFQFFIWSTWYVSGGTYLIQELKFSGTQIGMLYGTLAIAGLVSPFFIGLLADRFFSTEKLLAFFHGFGGILLIALAYTTDFWWFFGILQLYTFMYVPTMALSNSITFHHISDREKDFALIRVWGSLGWVIAGFMVSALQWEVTFYPFLVAGTISAAFGIYCWFLPKTPPTQSKKNSLKQLLSSEAGILLRNRAFIIFVIGITFIRIPASFYYSFVNPYLYEIGFPNPAGSMALGQIAEIALMLSLPFVMRKVGLKPLLVFGMFAWGFRYVLFGYGDVGNASWMIYLAILCQGITFNYTSLVGQIYVDQSVPIQLRATAQGFIVLITVGFGPLIGAYLSGSIVEHYTFADATHNWRAIFWVPALVGMLTAVWFFFAFWPKKA
ncbi:MAG: MFS transporter, partial [Bacteroidota bacterium]